MRDVPRARGLDVTWSAGRAGPGALRVGPPAPPPEEAPVPKERQPLHEGGCPIGPGARHAAIASGELWMARHIGAFDDVTSSCVCDGGHCAKASIPSHLQLLDGRGDVLVLGTRDPKAGQIHVTSASGASRGVAMAEGHCLDARIHEGGKAASVLCKDATSTFVVEVDVASGARTTRTPLAVLGTRHELVAAGPKALVVLSRHHASYDVLRVVEPRSGRALATLHAGMEGAVASFPDGTAEIVGDMATITPSLRCVEGAVSRPLSACGERALVKGRLAIDL